MHPKVVILETTRKSCAKKSLQEHVTAFKTHLHVFGWVREAGSVQEGKGEKRRRNHSSLLVDIRASALSSKETIK